MDDAGEARVGRTAEVCTEVRTARGMERRDRRDIVEEGRV
jgi:hypothetical protein